MKPRLNMDKIAKALGAQRKGTVHATGGYFGAAQLVAEVQERFRIPHGGGRPTDPHWTEKRLVGLSAETLRRLAEIASQIRSSSDIHLNAMQVAALLLEKAVGQFASASDLAKDLMDTKARPIRRMPSARGTEPKGRG
jgi:hypothetical protein